MQSKLFDRSVSEALNNVATKLSRQDAANFIKSRVQRSVTIAHNENENHIIEISAKNNVADKAGRDADSIKKQTHAQRKLALLNDSLKHMLERQRLDELTNNMQLSVQEYIDEFGNLHIGGFVPVLKNPDKTQPPPPKFKIIQYPYFDPQFGEQRINARIINPEWQREQYRKQNEKQVRQIKKLIEANSSSNTSGDKPNVMQNVFEEYQKSGEPLKKRLDPFWIDSLLRFELHNKDIYLPFSYEVTNANNDSLIFSKAMDMTGAKPVFIPADPR